MAYYRNRVPQAMLFGVVAGICSRLDWSPFGARISVLLLTFFMPLKVIVAYLMALWLMPESWRGR